MRVLAGAPPRILVLWDIDHTLIKTGGLGRELFAHAFHAATGTPMLHMAAPAGRTEAVTFRETAALHGLDGTTAYPAFATALADAYRDHIQELRARGRMLPGAHESLTALAARPEVVQGVLTGNLKAVAEVKLAAFGLTAFIDASVGAFADDGNTRADLVHAARTRAHQAYGHHFPGTATILIGDTPNDVTAAKATGAIVIAVASGLYTTEQLAHAGAEMVVPDLTDPAVVHSVLQHTQP